MITPPKLKRSRAPRLKQYRSNPSKCLEGLASFFYRPFSPASCLLVRKLQALGFRVHSSDYNPGKLGALASLEPQPKPRAPKKQHPQTHLKRRTRRACLYLFTYLYIHAHRHLHLHAHVYIYTYIPIYVYTYINIYIYRYKYL